MSAPSVLGTSIYSSTGDVTSWTPFTGVSVNVGSIVVVGADGGGVDLSTASTGWSKHAETDDTTSGSGSPVSTSAIFLKTINGSQDLVISSTGAEAMTAILLQVNNGLLISSASATDGSNPPNVTLSNIRDALWVAVLIAKDTGGALSPSGYSTPAIQGLGGTNKPSTYLCYKTLRALSENPGSWGGAPSNTNASIVWTIALYRNRRRGAKAAII